MNAPRPIAARPALILGGGSLLVMLIAGFFDPYHFFRAYLYAWLTCLAAALGAMALVMMHHLTGGRWGWAVRRPGEAAAATLPFVAIAFLPIALGAAYLFPWADAKAVAASDVLQHRRVAFSPPFVLGRSAVFLALWSVLGLLLGRWSLAHDRTGDPAILARLARLSAAGLVAYFVTMSLASVDWIASREPDWYSSTFGVVTMLGQAVTGLAFLIVVLALLYRAAPFPAADGSRVFHDLGNLLQTVVVLWAYVSFAQYLVIWSGNLQEDLTWFHHRTQSGWNYVGIGLITLHFGLPFLLLLFQRAKRDLNVLGMTAAGVLAMRWVDSLWSVAPSAPTQQPRTVHWLDFIAPLALGSLWWACFVWRLRQRPLVPLAQLAEIPHPLTSGDDGIERAPS